MSDGVTSPSVDSTHGILSGMRVVEAAAFVAAPLGGMTLAQMGADVIRIDSLGGGLDYRRWPVTRENTSLFWCGLNKSKRSVALDLSSEEGRELAMRLITAPGDDGGMLLTNFPPRGWLSYEKLSARRVDLIQVTLMGDRFGGSAVDYTINSRLGLPYLTGPQCEDAPINHVLPAWDLVTGQMISVALLAAERHRRRTAQGQHVKLALEDVALSVMGHLGFIAEAELADRENGAERSRYGNDLFGAFGRDFRCSDGKRIMVVALTHKQWSALVNVTGIAGAIQQIEQDLGLDLAKEGDRFTARHEIAELISRWVLARTGLAIAKQFDAGGVCWGRYQSIKQLVADDSSCSVANPMFAQILQPGVGMTLAPGTPINFSCFQRQVPRAAPLLGHHTEQVLYELLGVGQAEYGQLVKRQVAAAAPKNIV